MTKKIVKLAIVRTQDIDPCPFGLLIPFGCKYAGNAIEKMAPLSILGNEATDEEKEKISQANKRFLSWTLLSAEEPKQCKYTDTLVIEKEAVVCNYNDSAPGVSQTPLLGSPFYSKVMSNSLDGLSTYPLGSYTDYNISRNLYFGSYSIQGSLNHILLKIAKEAEDTANGACILFYCKDDSTILLLKRSNKVKNGNCWGLPGGHLQEGEFPEQGAVRELYEEMGFILDPLDIISFGHVEMNETSHCIIYVAAVSKETKEKWENKIHLNWEHDDYKWFKTSDIPNNIHPVAKFVLEDSANIKE